MLRPWPDRIRCHCVRGAGRPSTSAGVLTERFEQRPGRAQVRGVEPLSELSENGSENLLRLRLPPVRAPQASEADAQDKAVCCCATSMARSKHACAAGTCRLPSSWTSNSPLIRRTSGRYQHSPPRSATACARFTAASASAKCPRPARPSARADRSSGYHPSSRFDHTFRARPAGQPHLFQTHRGRSEAFLPDTVLYCARWDSGPDRSSSAGRAAPSPDRRK
jgi:hypothetical protein